MTDSTEVLILRLTASWVATVGYGNVYRSRIKRVLSGNLLQNEITITVLADDKQNDAFMSAHSDTVEFEMGCHRKRSKEPYPIMPISGFVDEKGNSWEIDYLKEVSDPGAMLRPKSPNPIQNQS